MAAQFIDRRVTEGFDGGLLDGAHHPFGLAVGPWVIGLGEAMLDAVLLADTAEDMADPSQWAALVPLHELYAVAHWEAAYRSATMPRSEEHTSELKSLMRISYAVLHSKQQIKTSNTIRTAPH